MPSPATTEMMRCLMMLGTVGAGCVPIALAQSALNVDCEVAAPAKSPKEIAEGPDSGTKNVGSAGWSGGGMGGSRNDTAEAGPAAGFKTDHPATAKKPGHREARLDGAQAVPTCGV